MENNKGNARKGTIKRVHVDQHAIRANLKGADRPVITVQNRGKSYKANSVTIDGPSEVHYVADGNTLSCGARCWVETVSRVTVGTEVLE
tara:strand:+ start:6195 stop:6461 length:267 start_codon:yes stop_codon:yes gene_type:complete